MKCEDIADVIEHHIHQAVEQSRIFLARGASHHTYLPRVQPNYQTLCYEKGYQKGEKEN